jgi:hypothetical protein
MLASNRALLREFQGHGKQIATSDEATLREREDVGFARTTES